MRPLILLSNDDGYLAIGLRTLRETLLPLGDVIVCAPESEQSATSHSLTLSRPLRLRDHGSGILSLDGTPADCVYVALHSGSRVLPRPPDLIVSGLNHGLNLGTDVFYSGTVAAAREGALKGYPAIAASATRDTDYAEAGHTIRRIGEALLREPPGRGMLLNVNFPAGSEWPLRKTRLGTRVYTDTVEFRLDPRGNEYLWVGGPGAEHRPMPGSDTDAFDEGCVGVTPLRLDLYSSDDSDVTERVVAALR